MFETEFGKIGIVVCFDRHYPESIRTEALKGASLILIPTVNTKAEPSEMFEWELRVQAFQSSVAIAYDDGYDDIYIDGDYDYDRYDRDSDYADGVDDAMDEFDEDW